jgi:hypothetical protein
MIPKKPASDLIPGGNRFSDKIILKTKNLDRDPIQLDWITVWSLRSKPMAGLTESREQRKSHVIPWSFEPAGLQPRKTTC